MIKKILWQLVHFVAGHFKRKVNEEKILPRKILIMRYGFLGDVLQTTPVLKVLHKKWPEAKIDYWVSNAAAPALKNNPHINTIISADTYGPINYKKPWGILKNASLVRKEHYDLAVCLGSDPMYGLLAWLSGVKFRVGLITDKKKSAFLTKWVEVTLGDRVSRQERYMELIKQLNIEVPDGEEKIEMFWSEDDVKKVDSLLGKEQSNLLALFCGAGPPRFRPWANRRWDIRHWIELASKIIKKYSYIKILLIGADQEVENTQKLQSNLPKNKVINLVGKTNFSQLGAILKKCRMLISNDSAPVFVAAAVGCPVVVIYGPEWPERSQPIGAENWQPVFVDIDCRDYCASFPQKPPECENECLSSITVKMVLEKIDYVLHNGAKESMG